MKLLFPIAVFSCAIVIAGACIGSAAAGKVQTRQLVRSAVQAAAQADEALTSEVVTAEFNRKVLTRVDELVRKDFYDEKRAKEVWPKALEKNEAKILASKDIKELSDNINAALSALKASHTQFVTANDETFYYLRALFAQFPRKGPKAPKIDFTGAIAGGINANWNEVRYVLDGSPAQQAGIKSGDRIISVNGKPYYGQMSFAGMAGKSCSVQLERGSEKVTVTVTPSSKDNARAYVEAIEKSVRIIDTPQGKLGYVHLWAGSENSHNAFEDALADERIQNTKGLIVDLRDGYGGNYFDDLDFFYRPKEGYPVFHGVNRKGEHSNTYSFYDKPVVALINAGVRSGKELVAYSLKKTKRGRLVGENTAGAVLGGRLFDINPRCSLYLAVVGVDLKISDTPILEGVGVAPDVVVPITYSQRAQKDLQLEEAEKLLRDYIIVH